MRIVRETKQSRLRHYIGAPKRFLIKARDFYVDSMVSFDGKVASANVVANCPVNHISHVPKNFGGYGSNKEVDIYEEKLKQLYRSISEKYNNLRGLEFDNGGVYEPRRRSVGGYSAMDRSYSIALGKIGTIDEEEPCDFQEHVIIKSDVLFPRSRSHAVTRNNGF